MTPRIEKAREAIEAFCVHDYEEVGELFSPAASWCDVPAHHVSEGRDEIVAHMGEWHGSFADARVANAIYTELADGRVLLECTSEGKQSGPFGPYPSTCGAFSLPSVYLFSFDERDRITRVDLYYDTMTLLAQLGHLRANAA